MIPRTDSFVSEKNNILKEETNSDGKHTNNTEINKNTNKTKQAIFALSNGINNKSFESTKTTENIVGHVLATPLLTIE